MKKVDIVIPVHNRWELTEQTLKSLLKNTDPKLYNLYVIDDGSTEENYKKLYTLINGVNLFRNLIASSPGVSRNMVTRSISEQGNRSSYLYHSDNDVYFTEGWLEKLITVFEQAKNRVLVLGGSCHPYLQNKTTFGMQPFSQSIVGIKDAISGYSQLMEWSTWDKYGPFDETMKDAEMKIMGSEDWAFCQKIIKDGFMVGSIEPEVVIPCGKTNTYGKPATGSETFKSYPYIKVI